ncbi:metal-dependent hydrolase [Candidatus Woesearchaeota archaeon]|nr:metal-dependent hydrolase [Candidatus Woesearchaeota archaeon]
MFITAHIVAGLLIGKLTGNYTAALLGTLLLDIDHLLIYIKEGVFRSRKRLWKVIWFEEYVRGDRTPLHSFTLWLPISALLVLLNPDFGFVFSLGYLAHLLMDMADNTDFYGFWPLDASFKGPIKYLSWQEILLTVILLIVWLLL